MFESRGLDGELILVNDGSTDHTGRLIDELAARYPFVKPIHHPGNRGMTAAWNRGRAASGRYVVIMDGDLQNLPEDVYRLYRERRFTNADVVQGWRSHIGRVRGSRYVLSVTLDRMLRSLFGMRTRDIKSGFFICDRDIFLHILRHRFSYFYFQTLIMVSAHEKGYRIAQIETLFEDRRLGESFISSFPTMVILKSLVDLAKGFVEFRLLSGRTDVLSEFLAEHALARPARGCRFCGASTCLLRAADAAPSLDGLDPGAALLLRAAAHPWLSPGDVRELQEKRFASYQARLRHVPYYREQLDRSASAREIQNIEICSACPTLTRTNPEQPLLRSLSVAREVDYSADHDHGSTASRSALRRQDAARDARGDDAAQHRVDRIPLRRYAGRLCTTLGRAASR